MSALLAAWAFISSPIGRLITVGGLALVLGFSQGWSLKARMDRSATLQTVIAKQRIDLKAAQDTAEAANGVIAEISDRDAKNLEVIRDLQEKLDKRPPNARCTLDDPTARGMRRVR